ncbi:origin recognition complex subunit 6-like [Trichoplusia ni]|uniref:Origin recognition complex subunit 6-like n=1 Tax=Trichoplusia ni TaxID=7111 RepID=A0A7E5WZS5_TRINI|nr:origin recognition complex subunit 6-like [Trichoplusia ni]
MATNNKTLQLMASKLGLGDEDKVLNKAAEFERLLQTKSIAGSNMSETSKVVICLDLAATMLQAEFDIKTAIKFSGLKPSAYTNSKKVVQNLLELNSDRLTTDKLCSTLQCPGVQELADRILAEYQKQAKMEVDLNLPQYVCMAVFQACRVSKVKISKSKIVEKSRLKPAQWAKLDTDWTKFTDLNFAAVEKKKRGRVAKTAVVNVEKIEEMEIDTPILEVIQETVEPYEDWKKRMLETAYKELRELEKTESRKSVTPRKNITPRKSPRKSVQKFSPYKSPSKTNGVRLLFPIDL